MPKTRAAGFPTKFATYFSNSLCNIVVPDGKTALVNMLMDKYPERKKEREKKESYKIITDLHLPGYYRCLANISSMTQLPAVCNIHLVRQSQGSCMIPS